MRVNVNIPPIVDFQNVFKWFAFFHSEEGKSLFEKMGKENFEALDFEKMDKEEAQLLQTLMQFSVIFLQLVNTQSEIVMMFPEIGAEALFHIAKGLMPYEKVLKHIVDGKDVSEMKESILSIRAHVKGAIIAEKVLEGYKEMQVHRKNGTKPKTGEAFLAEMRKEFAE